MKINKNVEESIIVSIIVPVYNGSNYIGYALNSLKNQTYQNIEVIVVNDGSRDDGKTESEVAPFLIDGRFKYFYKENGGVASALNYGLNHCSGDYVCWLSHDDLFAKDKIEKQIKRIVKFKNRKTIIFSKVKLIDENGKKASFIKRFIFSFHKKRLVKPKDYFKANHIFYGSLMLPKEFLLNNPFYNDLKFTQDDFSYFQMLSNGYSLRYYGDTCTYYRIFSGQGSTTRINDYYEDLKTMYEYFKDYYLKTNDKQFIKSYFYSIAKKYAIADTPKIIFGDMVSKRKEYAISGFTVFKANIIKGIYTILYKIKIKLFGR